MAALTFAKPAEEAERKKREAEQPAENNNAALHPNNAEPDHCYGCAVGFLVLTGLTTALIAYDEHASHSKRSAENDNDAAFAVLNNAEPAQCYRRLICDLASGAIPDNDKLLELFKDDVSPVSPKFEFVTAAKVGKIVKNAAACEVRYSCPLNTIEIAKLLA